MGVLQLLTYVDSQPSLEYLRANGFLGYTYVYSAIPMTVNGYMLGAQHNCYFGSYSNRRVIVAPVNDKAAYITSTDALGNYVAGYVGVNTYHNGYYYYENTFEGYHSNIESYNSLAELLADADLLLGNYDITYRLTNCTAPDAPTRATVGATVNVDFSFPTGYGIVNPSTDVYVTNNGVVVPSTYANGILTFTMPNPS